MNSQTIVNRANSDHFGHDVAQHNQPSQPKAPAKDSAKSKKGAKAAAAQNQSDHSASQPAPSHHDQTETAFRLDAPSAHEVLLAGNFTDWSKTPIRMLKGGGGVWHTKVSLPPGRHLYRFVVDGTWQDDPTRTERVPNPFGSSDTLLEIT